MIQVEDIAFLRDGSQFFTCSDLVSRDSADRNIMAWDYNKAVVLSNQIYQVSFTFPVVRIEFIRSENEPCILKESTT